MAAAGRKNAHLDKGSLLGLLVALVGIVGGFMIEGGRPLRDMAGPSAALIVFGGTLGATLIAHPAGTVRLAMGKLRDVFFESRLNLPEIIESIVTLAAQARKAGLAALDSHLEEIPDPYFRKALMLAVDGADLQEVRAMMELESDAREMQFERAAKVYESAGGYSPTIGIIGAVLGLIIVMNKLDDMSMVGHGIAAAFVATIYGVGAANILFLPAAQKIKSRSYLLRLREEVVLEGVCAIVEGLNPKLIRVKLEGFLAGAKPAPKKGA